jgi:methyl-accepting chemotaxis protein
MGTAGETINDIVSQVQRVTGLISEISNATREQTSGIGLVSQAVTQLDSSTQGNADLVRESTSAADSLRCQARELISTVDTFKIDSATVAA